MIIVSSLIFLVLFHLSILLLYFSMDTAIHGTSIFSLSTFHPLISSSFRLFSLSSCNFILSLSLLFSSKSSTPTALRYDLFRFLSYTFIVTMLSPYFTTQSVYYFSIINQYKQIEEDFFVHSLSQHETPACMSCRRSDGRDDYKCLLPLQWNGIAFSISMSFLHRIMSRGFGWISISNQGNRMKWNLQEERKLMPRWQWRDDNVMMMTAKETETKKARRPLPIMTIMISLWSPRFCFPGVNQLPLYPLSPPPHDLTLFLLQSLFHPHLLWFLYSVVLFLFVSIRPVSEADNGDRHDDRDHQCRRSEGEYKEWHICKESWFPLAEYTAIFSSSSSPSYVNEGSKKRSLHLPFLLCCLHCLTWDALVCCDVH